MDDNTNQGGMSEVTFTPDEPTLTPANSSRPSVPPWVAIVSIVIGALGLLCWGAQLSSVYSAYTGGAQPEGMPDMTTAHRVFEAGGMIVGVLLGIMLIAGGIGGYGRKAWAPTLLRTWAVLRLIVAAIGLVVAFVYVDELVQMQQVTMQEMMAEARASGDAPDMPELSDESLKAFLLVFMGVTTLAVCIWPIFVLSLARKRHA